MGFQSVESAFEKAVSQGVFPGAVVLVGKDGEVAYERSFGYRSLVPRKTTLEATTLFDLASLTKPLATAVAIMVLIKERKIGLDDQVTRFLPGFGVFGKNASTVRHLLNHSSGLPAWKPYYEEVVKEEQAGRIGLIASQAAKNYIFERIHREKPLTPPGSQTLYSDLGFMVLGEVVEVLTGSSLDGFCRERIFEPLRLRSMGFVDLTQLESRRLQPELVAPTEHCPWRKRILCGEVHDDNAYAMGGVAGHAGLFSAARDIHTLLMRLERCLYGRDSFLPQSLMEEFLTKDATSDNSGYALGWDTPSASRSASGNYFSQRSVGHLGFTGTSVWWDLEKHCHVVLLTNRVHPSRDNDKIRDFRPHIHDLIMKALFP